MTIPEQKPQQHNFFGRTTQYIQLIKPDCSDMSCVPESPRRQEQPCNDGDEDLTADHR